MINNTGKNNGYGVVWQYGAREQWAIDSMHDTAAEAQRERNRILREIRSVPGNADKHTFHRVHKIVDGEIADPSDDDQMNNLSCEVQA